MFQLFQLFQMFQMFQMFQIGKRYPVTLMSCSVGGPAPMCSTEPAHCRYSCVELRVETLIGEREVASGVRRLEADTCN